ncbi:hypothetical protein ACFPAF_08445 [Hymenobacter endophyticus]|uniref:PE-PGRS family protein n=1 Tax=Hymenobacter endophyticus TaxID=3076335 RepID=A0ABU3TGD1_9BACT|nr:hypothetical protein [Hymenobacter endophyticus]MDU0370414.1 hypothetical protein [Hymenobacter endophyticus]
MRTLFFAAALAGTLLSSCSEAQTQETSSKQKEEKQGKKKGKKGGKGAEAIAGLSQVGTMSGVPESSGLALTGEAGSFYTHGDDGTQPILYKISTAGKTLAQIDVPVKSHDWESVTRDQSGHVYIGDVGNNNNNRRDLVIYRLNPSNPQQVQEIHLKYPDQTEFPPAKDDRNFDCEATLWYGGKVYLFTKDRGQEQTSKVYSVPDQPGTYTAQLVAKLPIPGAVTDAALSPDGRRLVLLARQEMFVLEAGSLPEILKAAPRQISLKGAGQTEGAVFTENDTLYISNEQGALYTYSFQ